MDVSKWWCLLIFFLCFTTFGVYWCVTLLMSFCTFLIGLLSLLYVNKGNEDVFYRSCAGNPLSQIVVSDGGLQQIVKQTLSPKKQQKSDNRVTGSELIDSSLQEILTYIIRDYISPWYNVISVDDEFPEKSIKKTAQTLAINISNRVKEVDWIPYLTTRLVDDAASHLRLFKQARAKMKSQEKPKSPRHTPRRDVRVSPKRTHKRNKSETDIAWYFGNRNFTERKETSTERNVGSSSKFYTTDPSVQQTLEDFFFDLECTMENNTICRDLICTDSMTEKEFISELVELLLYILLPDDDFECKPLRYVLREIFSNCVLLPLITMLSDPDYINQAIIFLCVRDCSLPSDVFLTTLRITDNYDELKYTKELVSKEIQLLRSRDSGGESDLSIKQQLSSLCYVIKLIDNRLSKMDNCDSSSQSGEDFPNIENVKSIDLPLDFILKNSVALSYFIDYVSSISKQAYVFFYFNIEGWKVSVEQQLSDLHINKTKGLNENSSTVYENIRATAMTIYEQFLGERGEHKVEINSGLVHKLFFQIRNLNNPPSELWFDDIQQALYEKMQTEEEFYFGFKKSRSYVRLLEELDLLQQNVEDDAISLSSFENLDLASAEDSKVGKDSTAFLHRQFDTLAVDAAEKTTKHVRSLSDVTHLAMKVDSFLQESSYVIPDIECVPADDGEYGGDKSPERDLRTGEFVLCVKIIETGIVCEKGKTFGIYAVQVSKQYDTGFLEEWHIYRRYSDFHDLHTKIKDRFPDLAKISFPGKKTFHNMERSVLEKRMKMLGTYMQEVCQPNIIKTHGSLKELLMAFLEQGDYDRATLGGPVSSTIDTLVNPIKSGMKTIKNMPEQLIHTVDEVVEKVFHQKNLYKQEAGKVGASLDIESDDNIPLRIMLLLLDEVFDLKSRNQWLRRRIVTILRQIVRTMFGDIVNRRILDYVSFITSPKNVAHYLHIFKQSFWPNGKRVERKPDKDDGSKYRTRIAAKIALLSCLSDELKHIIGSDTTRKGLLMIFELFQRPVLNRRLLYVLFEGVLGNLFPEKDISNIFQKLFSKSKRYQDKQKELLFKSR